MAAKARIRPMSCPDCGYHCWGTRSWWERGLPSCPCGGQLVPTKPADLAFVGLIGQDDMPAREWTAICRENGWEDLIVRKGAAAKSWTVRRAAIRTRRADHCAYPGCGRWVAADADHCSAGHPQHEHVNELAAALPF